MAGPCFSWTVTSPVAIAVVCATGLAGCAVQSPPESRGVAGTVIVDGASSLVPLAEAARDEFVADVEPGVAVQVSTSSTSGGLAKFCAGETDVALTSRPMTQEEAAVCEAAGLTHVEVPVAVDALSVVVPAENDFLRCVTTDELTRLWAADSEVTLTSWSQLNSEYPDRPVRLFGPANGSGAFEYVVAAGGAQEGGAGGDTTGSPSPGSDETAAGADPASADPADASAGDGTAEASPSAQPSGAPEEGAAADTPQDIAVRADYAASDDDRVIVDGVRENTGALGIIGLSHVAGAEGIRTVAVDTGRGCVSPTPGTAADGSYGPLTRTLYAYTAGGRYEADPAVAAFVDYLVDRSAVLAERSNAAPLGDGQEATARNALTSLAGSG